MKNYQSSSLRMSTSSITPPIRNSFLFNSQSLRYSFCILSLLLSLSIGNVLGADIEYIYESAADNPGNAQDWFRADIDEYSSWSATKGGSNNPKYYSTGKGLRVYDGGEFEITSSKTIESIKLTFS